MKRQYLGTFGKLSLGVIGGALLLSACSPTSGAANQSFGLPSAFASAPAPAQVAVNAPPAADLAAFVAPDAFALLSEKDQSEASSAQYYALQTGRPGAPRRWSGDTGATGRITVGPFIRVNTLDCREFEHQITISTVTHTKAGTSCREDDGNWSVVG